VLVFTAYDRRVEACPEQAELLRLFDLTWQANGWETRVIPIDANFRPGRPFKVPEEELRRRRGRVFAPWWLLNFGRRPAAHLPRGGVCVAKSDGKLLVAVKTVAEAEDLISRRK
jgi:hypothetical protein